VLYRLALVPRFLPYTVKDAGGPCGPGWWGATCGSSRSGRCWVAKWWWWSGHWGT